MYQYIEDAWTKRLFRAIYFHYNDYKVEYAAVFWDRACNSAVLNQMPKGTPLESLKHRPIEVHSKDLRFRD